MDVSSAASAKTLVEASPRRWHQPLSVLAAPFLWACPFRLGLLVPPTRCSGPVSAPRLMASISAATAPLPAPRFQRGHRAQMAGRRVQLPRLRRGTRSIDCHRANARRSSDNAGPHFDAAWEPNHPRRRPVPTDRLVPFRAKSDLPGAHGRSIRSNVQVSADLFRSLCNAQQFSVLCRATTVPGTSV